MVRLVFRPYTQLRRSICTSESLRSSTRVSPGFNLARHSSPSFGSQQLCSFCSQGRVAHWKRRGCRSHEGPNHPSVTSDFCFRCACEFDYSVTRTIVRLLGPCFKTGRRGHRPNRDRDATGSSKGSLLDKAAPVPAAKAAQNTGLLRRAQQLHRRPQCLSSGSSRKAHRECGSQQDADATARREIEQQCRAPRGT